MLNFEYCNPTRIVFGSNTVARINDLIPASARVLVTYGGSSAEKNGTLNEVRTALGKREFQEFGGIEPNPVFETLMKAVKKVRSEKLDFLLAVGGGSVIDGTKFIAVAVPFKGDEWSIVESGGGNVKKALPLGTVLTLPATGSEMNANAVVTNKAAHAKLPFSSQLIYPQFSILDPTKTYPLPMRQVANGIVDAFVHVMEQYMTYPVQALPQDRFAEGLLVSLIEIAPKVLANPTDYETRANYMWIATLALNGLIAVGVPQDWATHMIGHEITALYNVDHARTLAAVLPSLLQEQRESKRGKLLQYAERVWKITEGSEDRRIDEAIRCTRAFFESLEVKTHLGDYNIYADAIDRLVTQLEAHGMTQLGERGDVTPGVSRRILQAAL